MKLLDDLEGLSADALAFARLVAAVRAGGRGVDRSGAVEVVLDADGRPAEVWLRSDWRGAVGPGGLPAAVRDAWSAAALDRLATWVATATDPGAATCTPASDVAQRGHAGRGAADGGAGASGRAPADVAQRGRAACGPADGGASAGGWLAAEVAERGWAARGAADGGAGGRAPADVAPGAGAGHGGASGLAPLPAALVGEAVGRDGRGRVVAEFRRGDLVEVRLDEGWVSGADTAEVGGAVRAALAAALGAADEVRDGGR